LATVLGICSVVQLAGGPAPDAPEAVVVAAVVAFGGSAVKTSVAGSSPG
jgi:hypothetical protein